IIFRGVGAGLYGMLVLVVLAVFIAGLMVGRTPEYLGKKIQAYEVKMAMLSLLVLCLSILGFTAWAAVSEWGKAGLNNQGPHGLSEMLYAFSSLEHRRAGDWRFVQETRPASDDQKSGDARDHGGRGADHGGHFHRFGGSGFYC